MLSSSGAAVDMLRNLSINSQMNSPVSDIRTRAFGIRDVLSSFDRDVLPSEFKPQIFIELDRPLATRTPLNQWTIQEDLPGTLLQWGVYNEKAYDMLKSLQSTSTLARCFHEKIKRRLQHLFTEYDELINDHDTSQAHLIRVAQGFRDVIAAIKEDRMYHDRAQGAVAANLLDAMTRICHRHANIVHPLQKPTTPRRGTRRPTSTMAEPPSSLFEALIKLPVEDKSVEPFMLDLLETFPSIVWNELEPIYLNIMSLLEMHQAPPQYKYRFGRLASGTRDTTTESQHVSSKSQIAGQPIVASSSRESSGSQKQAQSQSQARSEAQTKATAASTPVTGSKRAADNGSSSTRKGKKKTTR